MKLNERAGKPVLIVVGANCAITSQVFTLSGCSLLSDGAVDVFTDLFSLKLAPFPVSLKALRYLKCNAFIKHIIQTIKLLPNQYPVDAGH